jgi:hypothetical protein
MQETRLAEDAFIKRVISVTRESVRRGSSGGSDSAAMPGAAYVVTVGRRLRLVDAYEIHMPSGRRLRALSKNSYQP